MSWETYYRRKEALRDVLAEADRRRGDVTAGQLLAEVPQAADAFDSELELLLDAQLEWFRTLSGALDQIDQPLGTDARTRRSAVVSAWNDAAALLPGARVLLDNEGDRPELAKALATEAAHLGMAANSDGRSLRAEAADRCELPDYVDPDAARGLIARLRHAMAA